MAAVSIPPSPHAIGTMASRRAPLSNLPNAGNSPFRATTTAPTKRSRSQNNNGLDLAYGQPPPLKKKIVELGQSAPCPQPAPGTPKKQHGQILLDKVAAKKERASRAAKQQKPDENDDTLRQWQNHYRRAFPDFVFYFENVPDDVRRQCSRGIQSLGAVSCYLLSICCSFY